MRGFLTFMVCVAAVSSYAQVQTKLQSVSGAGTSSGQSTNATLKNSGSFGQIVSFGAGQSNRAGFFVGVSELAPSTQATSNLFSGFASNQLTISWTNGSGSKRLVLAHAATAVDAVPVNGIVYTANTAFGSGTQIGTGNYVVFDGTGSSVTVTGLSPSVVYHFHVFEYNGTGVTNTYKTLTATGNPASRTTLASVPVTQASALSFSAITNTSLTLSWTNGTGAKRIVLARQGAAVNTVPVNGQSYTASATFGSGDQITTGNYVVYDGAANSVVISGLTSNTVYHFQVFEYNGSALTSNYLTSGASNTGQKFTLTDATVAGIATAITQDSFTANWSSVAGATSYSLDVSTDSFATFVTGFNSKTVTGTSSIVDGLSSGTTYQFRVRVINVSGASANSNTIAALTVPATPVLDTPSTVTTTSFVLKWAAVGGADQYQLDISTSNTFTPFIAGYQSKSLTTLTETVTGLTAGTFYYIRLRTVNASGSSPNSLTVAQVTVPSAPTGLTTTSVTSSALVASWNAVTGADSYEIDVSKDNFSTFVTNYNPFSTAELSEVIQGLTASTVYRYRVRAVNTGGKSAATVSLPVPTLDSSGKSNQLTIGTPQGPASLSSTDGTGTATVQTTGGFGAIVVKFFSRKITETVFKEPPASQGAGSYQAALSAADFDELGLEYYFTATDDIGPIDSPHRYVYRSFTAGSSTPIPFSSGFDGSAATYQMFSVPYSITDKNVSSVFLALGAPDRKRWRLFHYQGGKYIEYPDNVTNIEPGKGYWFNTLEKVDINPGAGVVVEANRSQPYSISLEKGWNQIGNPFPFEISWATVKAFNSTTAFNSLWVFGPGGYVKSAGFKPWAGAFVFSDNGGTLSIPVTSRCTGCRTLEDEFSSNIDENIWQIPLTLGFNGRSQISSVGMHPDAAFSKDMFDEITMPRFIDYLEMNTTHPEFFAHQFSADVVPTSDIVAWEFSLTSSQKSGRASLTWDQSTVQNSTSNLVLFDMDNQVLLDMKTTNQYTFDWIEGKKIKVLYSRKDEIQPGVTLLGHAYPNPFTNHLSIPVMLEKDEDVIQVHVYDLMGRRVKVLTKHNAGAGIHRLDWDGYDEQGNETESGIYLYQLRGEKEILSAVKKVIKQ